MMIRRLEIGLFRMRTAFTKINKKNCYRFILIGGTCGAAVLSLPLSYNAGNDDADNNASIKGNPSGSGSGSAGGDDAVDAIIDQVMPYVQKLGFGGIMGVCSGVALKRLGNQAAGAIGLGFIILQGLAYLGYIDIDYGKVKEDAKKMIDQDGDGKITAKDAKLFWRKVKELLTFHLPGMGGFSAGFVLGIRYGS
mmetsp:Transcript_39982/g.110046  ORF Transcript_39982/g.110046 Transcript_39982/m.110046 type:complete len:194 (+) Transcript_39982:51-632(+)|eukprot:CAMPEP_0117552800 /NCGR_PEP_ID=MMETSP0784-20121206/49894_1 /TAXON_ID=39447 /ORGANISM="" /LENGTH=193 /DNA_ID=CAMNT_0005349883 /DNA_START=40 /DNA_END=621 /DNA_ORIENTATION=+